MTAQWIEVDGEVIRAIQDAAEPFVDNPNRVLRRLLGLPPIDNDRTAALPTGNPRAPRGSILPLPDYEVPILLAISEAGGSAARSLVLDALRVSLDDQLTDLDREPLGTGRARWEARADQARTRLLQRGYLERSLSGIWQLSEAGREYLDRRLKSKVADERRRAAE
jgi:hypothetical protein